MNDHIQQDDDPVDTIFEVTRVLAPSLVLSPATGGMSLPASLAIESGIETVNVEGAEDVIAGRWLAGKLGEPLIIHSLLKTW